MSLLGEFLSYIMSLFQDGSESKTPTELYKITALLLREKILQLDDIYLHVRFHAS